MNCEERVFRMKLKPGAADEYRRRHAAIWPELIADMRARGICGYRIWLDETSGDVFALMHRDPDLVRSDRPSAIVQRWWDHMADLMEVHADNAPVQTPLIPAFVLKGPGSH